MDDVAAVDSSPLILLGAIGRFEVLRCAARRVVMPDAVAREIAAQGPEEPVTRAIQALEWVERVDDDDPSDAVKGWDLGAGEASVLAFAERTAGAVAVLDDLAARRCAAGLGVPVVGTVGLVIRARRMGSVPAVRPILGALRDAGMWLSEDVIQRAANAVGE